MKDDPDDGKAISWSSVQEALTHAPTLVAATRGREHRLVYANDAYRRVVGPHAAPAQRPPSTLPTLLDPWLAAPLDDVFTTGRSCSVLAALGEGGSAVFPVDYAPLRDSDGEVVGVLVVGVDPSQQAHSLESLPNGDQHRREAAHELRGSLLAQPPQPDELQVAARYLPGAAEADAGGDWYDIIPLGAGRTALVIGDVMGHGDHAAEVMAQLRSTLRAYARLDLPPAEVLGLLDAFVSELHPVQIATCLYAIFDPVESLVSYSTAGHPAPVLRHADGTVQQLTARPGAPLGVLGGPYPVQQVPLPAGAILLLYTDGLVERRGEDVARGIATLADAISGADRPLEEFADRVLQRSTLDGLSGDDVALLLARSAPATKAGSPERSMRLQLSSGEEPARRARAYANGVLSAWHLPQPLREDIVVVVGELVANAVLHSGLAEELRLRRTAHRVVLEVLDRSPRAPRPRPADPRAESGRGLHLVAQLSDRWGARPLDGGKSVWCEFRA